MCYIYFHETPRKRSVESSRPHLVQYTFLLYSEMHIVFNDDIMYMVSPFFNL